MSNFSPTFNALNLFEVQGKLKDKGKRPLGA